MKKYLIILLLATLIIPSVALASWWNPFSWFNNWTFDKRETSVVQQQLIKEIKEDGTKKETDTVHKKGGPEVIIIPSKTEKASSASLNKSNSAAKQENIELSSINNLTGASISTSKLNYTQGENIAVNIELPEDRFSSCQFALIDPNGKNIAMGEGGCVAGIITHFDSRYMQEPVDIYVPKGEVMSFLSSGVSDGIEYGKLADNFGIWTLRILTEKNSGVTHVLETKFDYEKNSSMFKQVTPSKVTPAQKKIILEELVKFDGSAGMFTAQSYGLSSINVYVSVIGGDTDHQYILGSMILKNKDSNGLQTWTLSAYTKIGNDSPMKLGTYPEGTSIYAVGYAGYGAERKEQNKIYYPYKDNSDIYKNLY